MKKLIFLSLIAILCATSVSAKISGGFGYTLGDIFDESTCQSHENDKKGLTHIVNPLSPHEYFSMYFVLYLFCC